MPRLFACLCLLFAASCKKLDQQTYEDEFSTIACDRYASCDLLDQWGWSDVDACLEHYTTTLENEPATCDRVRSGKANRCLKKLEDLSCGELDALSESGGQLGPEPCDDVCK